MTVYVYVYLAVTILTFQAEKSDYRPPRLSTNGKVRHKRSTRTLIFLSAAILIFVSGFRHAVGTDFYHYYFFQRITFQKVLEHLKDLDEPIQPLFYYVIQRFTADRWVPILAFSAFTTGLAIKVIRDNTNKLCMSILLYLFLGCWTDSFNAVRQCMAASILFCGLPYLKNKQFAPYCAVVLLAFFTHRSSVVMIVPYFVLHNKINIRNILLLIIGTVVVLLSYSRLFSFTEAVLQQGTLSSDIAYYHTGVSIARVLAAAAPAVYFLLFYSGAVLDDEKVFYLNITVIHATLMLVTIRSAYLARVSLYTAPFLAVAIPKLNSGLHNRNRKLGSTGMFILYSAYWFYDIYAHSDLNQFHWAWEVW